VGIVAFLLAAAVVAAPAPARAVAPAAVPAAIPAPASAPAAPAPTAATTPSVVVVQAPPATPDHSAIGAAAIALVSALSAVLLTAWLESRQEAKRTAAAAAQEQARWTHSDAQDAARRAHEDHQDALRRDHEVAQEAARLATESRVRVHEIRLTAYVEFNAAVSDLFALAAVWLNNGGAPGTVSDAIDPVLGNFINTFQRASLLATPPVAAALHAVHNIVAQLIVSIPVATVTTVMAGRTAAVVALDQAMRQELGVA